uniref:Intraflagellar transport protein 74 homolog n=1 Tax=Syphacia muris TaxID=451379 RepID=A0A0N5AH94_9BILA
MTSRPTTARPKTSAGNRALSSRGIRRQTPLHQNLLDRRVGMGVLTVNEDSVLRAGLTSQNGSVSRYISSKAGAERHNLQSTGNISFAPPRTSSRPVTQQGLVGVRPVSRANLQSARLNRQVVDKSYYLSLLRSHMNNLCTEIENLKHELEKGERDRQDLLIYEKRAEEEAENLQSLHGRLIDLNVVVDYLHKNMGSEELEEEINDLKTRNDSAEETVNELFGERKDEELEVEKIEKMIECQKESNEVAENNLDPRVRNDIEELRSVLAQINEEYQQQNDTLLDLTAKKEALEEELKNSTLKRRALELSEQLTEIESKKESMLKELGEEASPEELRDQLLQTVTKTSNEISIIENQISTVNERILQCNEEIREFDMEFESTAAEKSSKYRELKLKEMQYDEFLNSYRSKCAEIEAKIDDSAESVIQHLSKISLNCDQINKLNSIPEIDSNASNLLSSATASSQELQQLYVCFQEEILKVKESQSNLSNEISGYKEQIQRLNDSYNDLEQMNSSSEQQQNVHLPSNFHRQEMLKLQLPSLEQELSEVDSELSVTNDKLKKNAKYQELKDAEKRLQTLKKRQNRLEAEASKRRCRIDYTPIKKQVKCF